MTKRVAILGCGPSGLLAAHAAAIRGWDFRIYSHKVKSPIYGAQYFHELIPGINCGIGQHVRYLLYGQPWQYKQKVYGKSYDCNVSPEDLAENHMAWDMRLAYDDLWSKYSDYIQDFLLTPEPNGHLSRSLIGNPDIVISTVPRRIWEPKENQHKFTSVKIWAKGDTEKLRVNQRPASFTIICSGLPTDQWYRVSNIFGHCTMEWPYSSNIRGPKGASLVEKPIATTSRAAPDFVHLGRYGAWQKGVLTTDVFTQALTALNQDHI